MQILIQQLLNKKWEIKAKEIEIFNEGKEEKYIENPKFHQKLLLKTKMDDLEIK